MQLTILVLLSVMISSSLSDDKLDDSCYNPKGVDCSWYRNCLEKRHKCEGTSHAYAISYAEKYCKLYGKYYDNFLKDGKKWIDGVRRCLQVALVPMIQPEVETTCAEIKDTAFKSHGDCYIKPGYGAKSICDLSVAQWFRSFWVVKYSILSSDWCSVIKQMMEVLQRCVVPNTESNEVPAIE